jgi:hypothetical protein
VAVAVGRGDAVGAGVGRGVAVAGGVAIGLGVQNGGRQGAEEVGVGVAVGSGEICALR